MWHLSWDAFRAYFPSVMVGAIALLGIWKDAPDYVDRVKGLGNFARKTIIGLLLLFTILVAGFGILDIHSGRVASAEAAAKAKSDKQTSDALIGSLQTQVGGLRQDGVTNARTFTDSFSRLNDKFSDLQAKVRNQDLIDQLASTEAELQATQKGLAPKPKAILESTFAGIPVEKMPLRITEAKVENGVVSVHLTIYNPSEVDGLNGGLKVAICESCKFSEEPAQFTHVLDDTSQTRELDFQHVFAKSKIPTITIKFSVPDGAASVQLGTLVICETCDRKREEAFTIRLIR
jgi:hypothetical protein